MPVAKLQGDKSYSIISDHIGTPLVAIDNEGVKVWERELDIYGKVRKLQGDKWFMPFLYQGQYYDVETELAYNRFRYYDPNSGSYISQDPIGLAGGLAFYSYVKDINIYVDVFGLVAPNNLGITKGIHGGVNHNNFIDDLIEKLQSDNLVDLLSIRKNQEQVDVNGNKVGSNRPDLQYDRDGIHHNVEVDTSDKGSLNHQNIIPLNDPNAKNTFWLIDENGNIRQNNNTNQGSCSNI